MQWIIDEDGIGVMFYGCHEIHRPDSRFMDECDEKLREVSMAIKDQEESEIYKNLLNELEVIREENAKLRIIQDKYRVIQNVMSDY